MNDAGETCLHRAAGGAFSIQDLQLFIDDCADVNATNIENRSAIVLLCRKAGVVSVSVLLKSLTDPNRTDTNGDTLFND